jgi:hypothetical protein
MLTAAGINATNKGNNKGLIAISATIEEGNY